MSCPTEELDTQPTRCSPLEAPPEERSSTPSTMREEPSTEPTEDSYLATSAEKPLRSHPSLWMSWWQEILFCVASLSSFVGIVVTLYLFDQELPPKWPLGITLNSLLALLSTICKASFMISLAEVIGQWKWTICSDREGRPLSDFSLIDLASRGFLGSCWLVGRFRWRHPITLAGVVSIFSVLTSPITQQALEYPTRSVDSHGRARVGVSHTLLRLKQNPGVSPLDIALQEGTYTSLDEPPRDLEPLCTTANCTFPLYQSLAICVKMADVSGQLNVSEVVLDSLPEGYPEDMYAGGDGPITMYYTSLPNNATFNIAAPHAFRTRPGNSSLAFGQDEAYKTSLMNYFITYTSSGAPASDDNDLANSTDPVDVEFRALEVMMYMCVNSYETVVTEGQSRTEVTSSLSSVVVEDDSDRSETPKVQCILPTYEGGRDAASFMECLPNDTDGNLTLAGVSSADDAERFVCDIQAITQVARLMIPSLFGQFERPGSVPMFTNLGSLWLWDTLYGPFGNITEREEQLKRVHRYYAGLATTVTNALRSTDSAMQIQGVAWQAEVYVHVRWGWLSFLATELLLAVLFVGFTVLATRTTAVPMLKNSVLAALLVPSTNVQQVVGTVEDLDDAVDNSTTTQVRFDNKSLVLVGEEAVTDDSQSSRSAPSTT